MSAIWIVLLDTSSSMNDAFSQVAIAGYDPLGEVGRWTKKIDAAKELLLHQVSLLRSQDIAIFQFSRTAHKIFHGNRERLLGNASLITSLSASGATNIAAAIEAVTNDAQIEGYRSISLLVLSDGLSDQAAAVKSASALVAKYPFARIDTILIDETARGRAVAESISINGTVRTALSRNQLEQGLSIARAASLRNELAHMPQLRFFAQQELAEAQQMATPTLIRVTSGEKLDSNTLHTDLAHSIATIELIGQAVSRASQQEYNGAVSSISQDSPISINLTGLKESVELVLTLVLPWRRRHAEALAMISVQKAKLELQKQEIDISLHDLDLDKHRLDNARMRYDVAKLHLELTESKIDLAERLLRAIDPNDQLQGQERAKIFAQLLAAIERQSMTRLEFEVVTGVQGQ